MPSLTLQWSRAFLLVALVMVAPARAQYADAPQALPVPLGGSFSSAVQIGQRLFASGQFTRLATPTGGAVVVNAAGDVQPGRFPHFVGSVSAIVPDGASGWFVGGAFTSVDGEPTAWLVHVRPDRRVNRSFRISVDGPVRELAVAHGRLYIVGDFTIVNGAPRRGFAVLDLTTGGLSSWAAGFDPLGAPHNLSISSVGVYVASDAEGGAGHLWGLDAGTGRVLFDRSVRIRAVAATSARVYVSGFELARKVWAVDAFTGQDTDWSLGLTFEPIPDKYYGFDVTRVSELLVADGRLYLAGVFRASGGRNTLTAVDAGTGQPSAWSPGLPRPPENAVPPAWLARVGPAVLAGPAGVPPSGWTNRPVAFDAVTATQLAFVPEVSGQVNAVAVAPEGVVLGGGLTAVTGAERSGLAAIELDTLAVSAWTSPWPGTPFTAISSLATDGRWLFASAPAGSFTSSTVRVAKIDPSTGAVMAEREIAGSGGRMIAAADEIILTTGTLSTGFAFALSAVRIDDWSVRALPTTIEGELFDHAVAGDAIYLAGRFFRVNGVVLNSRVVAVHRVTGALLPWHPYADADVRSLATYAGRVFAGGDFRRIGGQRRRSLAELDPLTAAALPWNPDVVSAFPNPVVKVAPDGTLFATVGASGLAAGQAVSGTIAYSMSTGARLPWRPGLASVTAALADCVLMDSYCLRRAVPAPTGLRVTSAGTNVSLEWSLPASPARTGVRLEVGRSEGQTDLVTIDLPAEQASFSSPAPPGAYFARVRALAGLATSLPTADVSFSVGPPDVSAAPLDLTAIMRPPFVTLSWTPPSTGAPPQYLLEAGSAPGQRDLGALPLAGTATSFTIDPPDNRYWMRLVAVNASGRSAPSNDAYVDAYPFFTCGVLSPRNLAASVSGRTVTLTWDPPADGSDAAALVVGSAPGLSDIATIGVPYVTSYTVAAPPGTYYVRVTAPCVFEPSNEVRVVVQ